VMERLSDKRLLITASANWCICPHQRCVILVTLYSRARLTKPMAWSRRWVSCLADENGFAVVSPGRTLGGKAARLIFP